MAQAARLSLRMQKEMKLLLTDPPPGASFPYLSLESDPSPSLSAIDADIRGPEGTVYAGGVFKLKIQIPERYPFQPPVVTFATQIYHPNIDNGGRICLDILNLPPKGAWQPSLNISTVLTSIGLLLSEPNPDDGLMCEASREYKYNRHAFDQKARSMTEKFATTGANGDGSSSKHSQSQSSATMVDRRSSDISTCELEEGLVRDRKGYAKLSLNCSKPLKNKYLDHRVSENTIDKTDRPKEVGTKTIEDYHPHHRNLSRAKGKLSLGLSGHSEQKVDDEKKTTKRIQNSSSMSQYSETLPERDGDRIDDNLSISKRKRLSLGISNSSRAQETDNKENTAPGQSLIINHSKNFSENGDFGIEHESIGITTGENSEEKQEMERSILSESVIVLDSEDSEEDESQGSLRPRLLLARKRLPGKTKDSKKKVMF